MERKHPLDANPPLHVGGITSLWVGAPRKRDISAGKLVQIVLDNYGSHKHPKVRAWLHGTHAVPSTSRRSRPLGSTRSRGSLPDLQPRPFAVSLHAAAAGRAETRAIKNDKMTLDIISFMTQGYLYKMICVKGDRRRGGYHLDCQRQGRMR
jgi:hypothetical protein